MHDSGGERELIIDLAEHYGVAFARLSEATTQKLAARLDPGLARSIRSMPGAPATTRRASIAIASRR